MQSNDTFVEKNFHITFMLVFFLRWIYERES